jgi:hypothetical protein
VLDPVVCQLIRSIIEPLLDDVKPPFICLLLLLLLFIMLFTSLLQVLVDRKPPP